MLEITNLSKSYGTGPTATRAIDHIDFSVSESEFVSVVGPSGCGKTTLLKCMAGLLEPTTGHTTLLGRHVTRSPPEMAVVFQDYSRSLFPWLTVRRNVELPLRKKPEVAERDKVVEETLTAVGLAKFAGHYPWQLSGGMQQRVAIARALAYQPKVLLMDEPFASVDAQTRGELEDLVLSMRGRYGVTCVLVTHDIDESVYMSDRVVVLSSPPSHVSETVAIDLPRPRNQVSTREHPSFGHLRGHVYQLIKGRSAQPAAPGLDEELAAT
jgi:NitT/TauT family transport system ATP-binding protein